MTLTGNRAKALGRRLRSTDISNTDLAELEEYRRYFDSILTGLTGKAKDILGAEDILFLLAGRLKRAKSIIRKLRQPQNEGMDLSRMADIAGIRLLFRSMPEQDRAASALQSAIAGIRCRDTRAEEGYRAIHLIVQDSDTYRRAEIQLRTLAQQLWADESESFGEEVKAGGGDPSVREYLTALSLDCRDVDEGRECQQRHLATPIGSARAPLSMRLPRFEADYVDALKVQREVDTGTSHILVFDNQVQAPLQNLAYAPSERSKALGEYQELNRDVDESRIETLMLNAGSSRILRVTHPRFFPE